MLGLRWAWARYRGDSFLPIRSSEHIGYPSAHAHTLPSHSQRLYSKWEEDLERGSASNNTIFQVYGQFPQGKPGQGLRAQQGALDPLPATCHLLAYSLLAGDTALRRCLNKLLTHFPPSLDDHLSLSYALAWHLPLHQGCPSWADGGQASQLGNVHVVAT